MPLDRRARLGVSVAAAAIAVLGLAGGAVAAATAPRAGSVDVLSFVAPCSLEAGALWTDFPTGWTGYAPLLPQPATCAFADLDPFATLHQAAP